MDFIDTIKSDIYSPILKAHSLLAPLHHSWTVSNLRETTCFPAASVIHLLAPNVSSLRPRSRISVVICVLSWRIVPVHPDAATELHNCNVTPSDRAIYYLYESRCHVQFGRVQVWPVQELQHPPVRNYSDAKQRLILRQKETSMIGSLSVNTFINSSWFICLQAAFMDRFSSVCIWS